MPLASQALMNFDNRVALEKINEQLVLEIQEKEKAQALIINSSKMAALGEMAGGIAHEINTPLAAMILRAELMEMENEESKSPSPNIAAGLRSIVETGHRIAKIIMGLKSFSRDARNDSSEIFLSRDLVERTVALCGERFKSYGVELRIQDDSGGAQIYGQVVQLSQVLLNLLNNSFDAVRNSKEKWIELSIKKVGDQLEIGVTDSGTGIPPAVVEKMFQPFFTTKEVGQGTGLGLSISANIVKNHSGQLIYDADHTNTCFLVRLPVVLEGIREKKNG
jgi:C4-dicarboxylate-specific signal transduction histidine kinase